MNNNLNTGILALRLWFQTCIIFIICAAVVFANNIGITILVAALPAFIITLIITSPLYLVYLLYFNNNKLDIGFALTSVTRLIAINFFVAIVYGFALAFAIKLLIDKDFILLIAICILSIFLVLLITCFLNYKLLQQHSYLYSLSLNNQNHIKMETENYQSHVYTRPQQPQNNKTLIKGLITAGLILALLIPAYLLQDLVKERESRQQEVVAEVSNKWAAPQIITGPYLYITYKTLEVRDGKAVSVPQSYFVIPEMLETTAGIEPQELSRSIYKVLLYKSNIAIKGNIKLRLPKEADLLKVEALNVRLCMGLSDFKGIEESIHVNFNNTDYELTPGLPTTQIDSLGLSIPVNATVADLGKQIDFATNIKVKGSRQLHFTPLSGNSKFIISSTWQAPSFDGSSVPGERTVSDGGFTAKWNFNKANLPFATGFTDPAFDKKNIAFGVSLIQPADNYAKTMRSVKYAILFIGLTFALFFIIELMQKRPVHPVQYVLIGLALIIFFALLLSIGEVILFDYAYVIAATATILLITFYAKSHFKKTKIALLFASVLTGLYGFIYILISLEDTALLVGSIGLFIVLALVMYASRKINWYGNNTEELTA